MNLRPLWCALGIYLAIGAIAFLLTPVSGPFPIAKTGNVGEWMAGLGAALAVAAALRIASNEHQSQEYAQWRREATDRVENARSVIVSLEQISHWEAFGKDLGYALQMVISNHSRTPVRSVRFVLEWSEAVRSTIRMQAGVGDPTVITYSPLMAPGDRSGTTPVGAFVIDGSEALTAAHVRSFGAQFVDVYGDEWIVRFGNKLGNASSHQLTSLDRPFWKRFPEASLAMSKG